MKIAKITSHVLQYDLPELLGYSQQYYAKRSAHLVRVETDDGVTGWGECFGPGTVAIANKTIVEKVIQPLILGMDPVDRDVIWHKVYNLLRDHGQKGMPMQACRASISRFGILPARVAGLPLHKLIGGAHRSEVAVYGYGMMLRPEPADDWRRVSRTRRPRSRTWGLRATKMKVGLAQGDVVWPRRCARASATTSVHGRCQPLLHDSDAFYVGRALEELDAYWFEEPVAPEDLDGYRELAAGLKVNISGGEAEFNRWGWRSLLEARGLDIAQPEVCALGGISSTLRVLRLCHAHFTPVINHVWGSAIAVATNLHLLGSHATLAGRAASRGSRCSSSTQRTTSSVTICFKSP